jgi:hypothetical protein
MQEFTNSPICQSTVEKYRDRFLLQFILTKVSAGVEEGSWVGELYKIFFDLFFLFLKFGGGGGI